MKPLLSLILCFAFATVFGQNPERGGSESHNPEALIQEGIRYHDNGDYDKAVQKYLAAIALDPKNATAYYEASYSYHLKRDYENALKMADKAIEYAGGDTKRMAVVVKGSILDDMGRRKESVTFYEKAIKDYPEFYLLWFNYGVTLATLKRFDEAENAYIKGLTFKLNHPGSNLQLGKLKDMENMKAPASLCYYFFLLLEPNTARSKDAAASLRKLLYGNPADTTNKGITINLSADAISDSNPLSSAELLFGLLGTTGNDIDKATGTKRSSQQRFVNDTERYFGMLSELKDKQPSSSPDKKKKKKKEEGQPNFYFDTYVPFFSDLKKADHVEAFCYHIMKSMGDPEVDKWTTSNQDKLNRFYTWLKTR
jgi:tetratricopeptide (TPR) repeat protein